VAFRCARSASELTTEQKSQNLLRTKTTISQMRPCLKTMACLEHPLNDRRNCLSCVAAWRAYKEALRAWKLSQTAEMRVRMRQARCKPKPITPELRMDTTTWEQWSKRKYQRNQRDVDIRQVYRAEVLRRGFRNAVPSRLRDPNRGPLNFYPVFGLASF
jgi:hypothetical protein